VIVTTPQDIALLDARKGIEMFAKVACRCSASSRTWRCTPAAQCGHTESIFGADGGERIAAEYGVPLLASLPLERQIREQTDAGRPTVVADPESAAARAYLAAADALPRPMPSAATGSDAFPDISITDD
jgi:ATP-binding protein involved in chromosome partitioning